MGLRALGGRLLQSSCLPDFLSKWFALLTKRCKVSGRLSEIKLLYHPLPSPFLVPSVLVRFCVCVNQMTVWAKIPVLVFTLKSCPYCPTSASHPSSQPLRVDVAVLPTSTRGQDPTFSNTWLTSSMQYLTSITHVVHLDTISSPCKDVTWRGQRSWNAG